MLCCDNKEAPCVVQYNIAVVYFSLTQSSEWLEDLSSLLFLYQQDVMDFKVIEAEEEEVITS